MFPNRETYVFGEGNVWLSVGKHTVPKGETYMAFWQNILSFKAFCRQWNDFLFRIRKDRLPGLIPEDGLRFLSVKCKVSLCQFLRFRR